MNPTHSIQRHGASHSFPVDHPLLAAARDDGEILLLLGKPDIDRTQTGTRAAVAVELGTECLSVHTGGCDAPESSNVVGFARWRLGDNPPSNLIELVVETGTKANAVAAVRAVFEGAGFVVSVCADRAGRIVDRLMRPQFNLALRAVDDGVASPADLEQCLKLGLGYRNGLLDPLLASGLHHHARVTSALFEVYGEPQYAPARRAVAARMREARKNAK